MDFGPDIALIAGLIGDPVRATLLAALIDGRALPAGELAFLGNVAPQTASFHLSKLLGASLLLSSGTVNTITTGWLTRQSPQRSNLLPSLPCGRGSWRVQKFAPTWSVQRNFAMHGAAISTSWPTGGRNPSGPAGSAIHRLRRREVVSTDRPRPKMVPRCWRGTSECQLSP